MLCALVVVLNGVTQAVVKDYGVAICCIIVWLLTSLACLFSVDLKVRF